jgi:putative serine protease PepD
MTEKESRPVPASISGRQPPPQIHYPPYYGYLQQAATSHFPEQPAPALKPKKKSGRTAVLVSATALAAALVGGASGATIVGLAGTTTASGTSTALSSTEAPLSRTAPTDVSGIAAKVLPSVVQVYVTTQQGEAIGSGVILTSNGQILTNAHVVAGAVGNVTITLADGMKYQASVTGANTTADIAVVQAQNASGLTPAILGDSSSKLAVGDSVVAIGSPGGLQNTVTSGIVSALNRNLSSIGGGQPQSPYGSARSQATESPSYTAIQTDASINQGNSGGPLVNAAGQVIGINSAMYSPTQSASGAAGSVGIGFAIPINDAKTIISQIIGG